jgi:hypothetical protein
MHIEDKEKGLVAEIEMLKVVLYRVTRRRLFFLYYQIKRPI